MRQTHMGQKNLVLVGVQIPPTGLGTLIKGTCAGPF